MAIQDTLIYPEPKPSRPSYNDVWSSSDGANWTCHTEHAAFRRRHYHEVLAWDDKLWVLEGYNGHPDRYPEEPPDVALPAVGDEGNRNDVWFSEDGAASHGWWLHFHAPPPPPPVCFVGRGTNEIYRGV
jgi:hypothetical protein